MRTRLVRLFVMFAPALPVLSCSLMGLDDFGVTPCKVNDDCREADSQLRPKTNPCGSTECDRGLCKWHPGVETCNGDDDDCDGLIDNGLIFSEQTAGAAQVAPIAVTSTSDPLQTFVAAARGDDASWGFALGEDVQPTKLNYVSKMGPDDCPITATQAAPCNFEEVALAADDTHLVVASINTKGCAAGQLRVGLSDIGDMPFQVFLGQPADVPTADSSNIAFGVNVDEQGCTRASGSIGAARPAVASLGTDGDGQAQGALVLWLAASEATIGIGDGPFAVEALGLSVPMGKPEWLNGTDGGPTELGWSTSSSAPAVMAVKPSAGGGKGEYLVAFPSESSNGPGIRFVTVSADDNKGLNVQSRGLLDVGVADHVALAPGNSDRAEVGLAWSSGSGAAAQLHFTVVSTRGEPLNRGELLTIPTSTLQPPQLLYRREGFAKTEPRDGWFLSWVVGESDGARRFQVARLRVGAFDTAVPASLPADGIPVLFPSKDNDSSVGYVVLYVPPAGEARLETKSLWCQ